MNSRLVTYRQPKILPNTNGVLGGRMNWQKVCALVVDDQLNYRSALVDALQAQFPTAELVAVSSISDGVTTILEKQKSGRDFQIICINEGDLLQASQEFQDQVDRIHTHHFHSGGLLFKYSLKNETSGETVVRQFITRARDGDNDLILAVLKLFHNRRVDSVMQPLLAARSGLVAPHRQIRGGGRCGTHGLAEDLRWVHEGWEYLEPDLQERVKLVFDVRSVDGELLVNP